MWLTSFWVADLFTIKQKLWTNKTPDVSCDTHKRCARLSPTRLLYFVYSEHKKSYIVHYAYYIFIYVTYSRVILFVNQTFTLQKQNWPHYQRSEQSPASPSCNYNSCSWHQQLWVMIWVMMLHMNTQDHLLNHCRHLFRSILAAISNCTNAVQLINFYAWNKWQTYWNIFKTFHFIHVHILL